ncbi:serine/threonine protein kinase [Schlesneria sp.]|uniref:serine/threonine protein kinase n=1 Tax=Schlesneria sp. TaxID=2762018 RepID=UPI002F217775
MESEKEKTASASEPIRKATSQLGKYRLLKKLGQGGMGEVYLAEDTKLGRQAAVKVLSKTLAREADFIARFQKEARAMARINHDNAVSVFDVDEDHGLHYVAMEYVDGKSMQQWLNLLGTLSVGDALHVALRCAEVLQFAHKQNLIHRDIKPDNIMLTRNGKVKVADFGLAKALDDDLSMTASGMGLGTPYYMAPEQARNAKHVDRRSDIYALGITLYHLLTGQLPFKGESVMEVIMAKELGKYPPARKLNQQVPDKLDLIISKMIEKDPAHRMKDCDEVIKLLAGLGLENSSLSFIETADRVVQSAAAKKANTSPGERVDSSPISNRANGGTPPSSDLEDEIKARTTKAGTTSPVDQWIVQYKTPQGKETLGRFSTLQLQTALKTGIIDLKARIKKNPVDSFVPIGFYPEFERAVEGRLVKEKAERKSAGLKSEFDKIGRQYDRRAWTRWIKDLVSGTAGLVTFILWLTFVFGGLAAVIIFRQQIWDSMANFLNSLQK